MSKIKVSLKILHVVVLLVHPVSVDTLVNARSTATRSYDVVPSSSTHEVELVTIVVWFDLLNYVVVVLIVVVNLLRLLLFNIWNHRVRWLILSILLVDLQLSK